MLRSILLSSVALAAVTSAFAADLPARNVAPAAPYVAAPIFTWTGFYVGADIGGGWTSDKFSGYTAGGAVAASLNQSGSGVVGGLLAGYNWQASNNFVIGVEGDVNVTSISPSTLSGALTVKESEPWQGSLRLRAGYAVNQALFYVTGGLALSQINTKFVNLGGTDSFTNAAAGWTLGGGIEYAFNNNWTARGEYRYTQFGGQSFSLVNTAVGVVGAGGRVKNYLNEQTVLFGIAYKFGAPATSAVVAKY